VSLQDPEAGRLLDHIVAGARSASWHVVTRDGHVRSAGAGVAPVLHQLRGGTIPAVIAEVFPATTERAYVWLVRNRRRLGRALGAKACDVNPSRSTR
jgi:predicted DCC family thiol-disulfide oxidoreductase YuxK